jgi:hypothetical protein
MSEGGAAQIPAEVRAEDALTLDLAQEGERDLGRGLSELGISWRASSREWRVSQRTSAGWR